MTDPGELDFAPVTRHLRAVYRSRLLIAAVSHLKVFDVLCEGEFAPADLARTLGLNERPANVLFPALRAMGVLEDGPSGRLRVSDLGRSLQAATQPNLADYVGLEAGDPGVVEMAERLKRDGPVSAPAGTAYVKDGEAPSPMDDPQTARFLTLALAGRARLLSPIAARALPRREGRLLDVAGGVGVFAYEWLLLNPRSTAIVLDRPPVLEVAAEFLEAFCGSGRPGAAGVRERVTLTPGDMLMDDLPQADLVLAASLFHDWRVATCRLLARRFADALAPGGELWVHDAFLNDAMDGPLPVTDYSAQLFWFTKGRAYSRAEYRGWFADAGLVPTDKNVPTRIEYGLISAVKPGP